MEQFTQSMKFEQSLERLEQIVRLLEKGEAPLEDALTLFTEGTDLINRCTSMLDQAQLQVVQVVRQADGTPAEMEFAHE